MTMTGAALRPPPPYVSHDHSFRPRRCHVRPVQRNHRARACASVPSHRCALLRDSPAPGGAARRRHASSARVCAFGARGGQLHCWTQRSAVPGHCSGHWCVHWGQCSAALLSRLWHSPAVARAGASAASGDVVTVGYLGTFADSGALKAVAQHCGGVALSFSLLPLPQAPSLTATRASPLVWASTKVCSSSVGRSAPCRSHLAARGNLRSQS